MSAGLLARYAGTYRYESADAVTYIKADGVRLYASDDGQSWDELLARSETVFFPKGRTVSITFITDTAGIVTGFVVDTGSGRIAARRVR